MTADDFGFDARVNAAIVRGFSEGLLTHASLLVNLPGFEDACRLIAMHRLADRIGLHLNLTQGVPLTPGIRRTSFCADGRFVPPGRLRYYRILSPAARRAVADEVSAQIDTVLAAGIRLIHLDSHNDIHTAPAVASVVTGMAVARGIVCLRPARNCGPRQGLIRWMHHRQFNRSLTRLGVNRADYFGTIDDLLWLKARGLAHPQRRAEAMTHPRLQRGTGELVDAPSTQSLASRVSQLLELGFVIDGRDSAVARAVDRNRPHQAADSLRLSSPFTRAARN